MTAPTMPADVAAWIRDVVLPRSYRANTSDTAACLCQAGREALPLDLPLRVHAHGRPAAAGGRPGRLSARSVLHPADRSGGMTTQPVPDPGNLRDYVNLLTAGLLVDLAGRALRLVDCKWCKAKCTSGITCPYSIDCPTCRRKPGQRCKRPSGHVLSSAFAGIHPRRIKAAAAIDDRREREGDDTVPAPWPGAPAYQLDLFATLPIGGTA